MAGGNGAFLDVPAIDVEYGDSGKRQTLRVTPLRIKQIPRFARAYQPMLQALSGEETGGKVQVSILGLIEQKRDELLTVAAIATDTAESFLGNQFDVLDFAALVQAIFDVNSDFLNGPSPRGASEPGVTWGWEDSIQHLVAAGHREVDVLDYTIAKLNAYGRAVDRQDRLRRAAALIDARCAALYEQKDFLSHFKSLTNG